MLLKHLLITGLGLGLVSARALNPRTVTCVFSTNPDSGATCESFAAIWGLSVDDFKKLNPGITCPALDASKSYCVSGTATEDVSTTSSSTSTTAKTSSTSTSSTSTSNTSTSSASTSIKSTSTSTSTSATISTTTTTGNGVTTPTPTQAGMVSSCSKFHFVQTGQTCDTIAALYSISTAQFIQWNPAAKSDCTGLWASTYACVGVLAGTSTTPGNGVVTPSPIQSGMVANCNKFALVNSGDSCDSLAFWNGVTGTGWVKLWNPAVGADCSNLKVGTYMCVGVIPTPTPTTVGQNGIATPLPTQPGMVSNCNNFVIVLPGDTCNGVAFYNVPVSLDNFVTWNAGIGGTDCRYLQSGAYACVGVTS